MKKYKLIKEYPSCEFMKLKKGSIVKQLEFSGCTFYNETGDVTNLCLNKTSVENYPEFWEEVKEKEWEIIKLKAISSPSSKPISDQFKEGKIRWSNDDNPIWKIPEELLKEKDHCIYQIKRLSDREIFTIEDRVKNGVIKNINIEDDELKIIVKPNNHIALFEVDLSKLEKVNPLFTTEDGVDIYEGDECWYALNRNSFEGDTTLKKRHCNGKAKEGKYFFHKDNALKYLGTYSVYGVNGTFTKTSTSLANQIKQDYAAGDWKWFNSEKERDEYIEKYKPRFSKEDMLEFETYCRMFQPRKLAFEKFIESKR